MKCYVIEKVRPDGYVILRSSDHDVKQEIPIKSTKIMFESGNIHLVNPDVIYETVHHSQGKSAI